MANSAADSRISRGTRGASLVWGSRLFYKPKKKLLRMHKYWCELHREVSYYPRELRLFNYKKRSSTYEQVLAETIPLPLKSVLKISLSSSKSFNVMTTKANYFFMTDTEEDSQVWVQALNNELFGAPRQGIIYEYNVEVVDSSVSQMYDIKGSYLLKVYDQHIQLYTPTGLLATRFHCDMKDIARVIYKSIDTVNGYSVSLLIINIITSSQLAQNLGGTVMVFQAESAADAMRVITCRKKLIADHPEIQFDDIKSTSLDSLLRDSKMKSVPPCARKKINKPKMASSSTYGPDMNATKILCSEVFAAQRMTSHLANSLPDGTSHVETVETVANNNKSCNGIGQLPHSSPVLSTNRTNKVLAPFVDNGFDGESSSSDDFGSLGGTPNQIKRNVENCSENHLQQELRSAPVSLPNSGSDYKRSVSLGSNNIRSTHSAIKDVSAPMSCNSNAFQTRKKPSWLQRNRPLPCIPSRKNRMSSDSESALHKRNWSDSNLLANDNVPELHNQSVSSDSDDECYSDTAIQPNLRRSTKRSASNPEN